MASLTRLAARPWLIRSLAATSAATCSMVSMAQSSRLPPSSRNLSRYRSPIDTRVAAAARFSARVDTQTRSSSDLAAASDSNTCSTLRHRSDKYAGAKNRYGGPRAQAHARRPARPAAQTQPLLRRHADARWLIPADADVGH